MPEVVTTIRLTAKLALPTGSAPSAVYAGCAELPDGSAIMLRVLCPPTRAQATLEKTMRDWLHYRRPEWEKLPCAYTLQPS